MADVSYYDFTPPCVDWNPQPFDFVKAYVVGAEHPTNGGGGYIRYDRLPTHAINTLSDVEKLQRMQRYAKSVIANAPKQLESNYNHYLKEPRPASYDKSIGETWKKRIEASTPRALQVIGWVEARLNELGKTTKTLLLPLAGLAALGALVKTSGVFDKKPQELV